MKGQDVNKSLVETFDKHQKAYQELLSKYKLIQTEGQEAKVKLSQVSFEKTSLEKEKELLEKLLGQQRETVKQLNSELHAVKERANKSEMELKSSVKIAEFQEIKEYTETMRVQTGSLMEEKSKLERSLFSLNAVNDNNKVRINQLCL